MIDHGLWPDFSAKAMAESACIDKPATGHISQARDFTKPLWGSIDNDDSRGLDQLTLATPRPDGSVAILVAIADVDALVPKDSALDAHARHKTTSVYTSGETFPMLADKLSTDLTSLGEGQDRLAMVVEFVVAETEEVKGASHYRALAPNHAKLAYSLARRNRAHT